MYTFMYNSSSIYSLNWRHIVTKLQHPVYYWFINDILKHEGDILHICVVSVEIICFRRVNKGFPVAYFPSFAKLLMRDLSPRTPVGL